MVEVDSEVAIEDLEVVIEDLEEDLEEAVSKRLLLMMVKYLDSLQDVLLLAVTDLEDVSELLGPCITARD